MNLADFKTKIHGKVFSHPNEPLGDGMQAFIHYDFDKNNTLVVDNFRIHFIINGEMGSDQADIIALGYPDVYSKALTETYQELYKHISNGNENK